MADPRSVPPWLSTYLDAWNAHDPDAVVALVTEDVRYGDLAIGADLKGRDELRAYVADMARTWSSDHRFTIRTAIQDGDGFCFEWSVTGTNDGANPALGLPATGESFTIHGAAVGRLVDGKVAEYRDYWNLAGYLVQVGLMPAGG